MTEIGDVVYELQKIREQLELHNEIMKNIEIDLASISAHLHDIKHFISNTTAELLE